MVLTKTVVSAKNLPATEQKGTYVLKRDNDNQWLYASDNFDGHSLLEEDAQPSHQLGHAKSVASLGFYASVMSNVKRK